jgi:hypothetical protein
MESNTKPEIESEIKVSNEKGRGNKSEKGLHKYQMLKSIRKNKHRKA